MSEVSLSSISLSLIVIAALILVRLLIRNILFLRKLPPGPWGVPVLGSMPHLLKNNVFEEFEKYRQKYGDIFSIGLGEFNAIVISGHKLIHEAFKRDEFIGRPDVLTWKVKNQGVKNRGILFCDGDHTWNEQRRFALRNLRDFGFGKESMEVLLINELQELISHLKTKVGKPFDMKDIFNASVLNSLWYIMTGHRFQIDDSGFKKVVSLLTTNVKSILLVGFGFWFPWPIKMNIIGRGKWEALQKGRKEIADLIEKQVKEHLETYDESHARDYIDVYIQQTKKCDPNSSFYGKEGMINLVVTMQDLFLAGVETTSTTLLWAVLLLSRDQRIQDKLFAEIDLVIGKNRLPTRDDKINMPYTEAVFNEVHRFASLVPLSIFHKVFKDTEFGGHFFPKDTVIFANLYGAHHDKDYWKDPENFRPERFLDATETKLKKEESLIPFSTGKRVCLGETLARDTLFIFLTGIMQQFSFELVPGSTDFDPKAFPTVCSLILQPDPFQVILKNRL